MQQAGFRYVTARWRGLGKCQELYFSWKPNPPKAMQANADHDDIIMVQLSATGAFANKDPDFSGCQLAVRLTASGTDGADGDGRRQVKMWLQNDDQADIMGVCREIWQKSMTVLGDLASPGITERMQRFQNRGWAFTLSSRALELKRHTQQQDVKTRSKKLNVWAGGAAKCWTDDDSLEDLNKWWAYTQQVEREVKDKKEDKGSQ